MISRHLHGCTGRPTGAIEHSCLPTFTRQRCRTGLHSSKHLQCRLHQLTHAAARAAAAAAASTNDCLRHSSRDQRPVPLAGFLERVKAGMTQHGPSFFFTYITLSNVASCAMLATGMALFVRTAGHSPLANGQWPSFIAFYAGVWSMNQTSRSARLAAAAVLTPAVDRPITWLAERLQCDKPRAVLLLFLLEAPMLLAGLAGVLAACCGGLGCIFM